jgi:sec-independent protein translocase protein TatA
MIAIFQQIGLPEILLILGVLVLLFGARKLPELARSMGRSTKEFKAGMKEEATEEPAQPGSEGTEPGTKPEPTSKPE